MIRYATIILFSLYIGCSTSETTTRTQTERVTRSIDTLLLVLPGIVEDTLITDGLIEDDSIDVWVSTESDVPKFEAKRNRRTGSTIIKVTPTKKVEVKVQATETRENVDQKVEQKTTSWLSEFKDIIIWGIVGLVVLIGILLIVKKQLGL